LTALGLVAGLVVVLDAATTAEVAAPAWWAGVLLRVAAPVLGGLAAGWGIFVLIRLCAVITSAILEQFIHASDELVAQVGSAVDLLKQITRSLEVRRGWDGPVNTPSPERELALVEIGRATRSARWSEAEELMEEFERRFPGDDSSAEFRTRLATVRRDTIQAGLAQIDASRNANDADHVLQLYSKLAPSLGEEDRATLTSDLASWFMGLIHRRLRSGKIQPDVVQLAGRFADTFATTVEGASVRASLPMLRRSVGLCPRCAEPYLGIAEACPACLGKPMSSPPTAQAASEPTQAE
jgi:hypothetical protein